MEYTHSLTSKPSLVSERAILSRHIAKASPLTGNELVEMGIRLHQAGDLEAALAAFECASSEMPSRIDVWHAVSALRLALNRPQAALLSCNFALEIDTENVESLFNVAVVLAALGLLEPALHAYDKALANDPQHFGSGLNRITCLLHLGRIEDAILAGRMALDSHPGEADLWFNLGEAYTSASDHQNAQAAYEQALTLDAGMTKAAVALAVSLAALGRLGEASARFQDLHKHFPEALQAFRSPLLTDAFAAYPELEPGRIALIAAYADYRACKWRHRDEFVQLYKRVIDGDGCRPMDNPDLPFLGIGLPLTGEYRLRAASQVARRIAGKCAPHSLVRSKRSRNARLRIGYVSGDFRQHPTAYLIARLFELHDRTRFEVFAYSTGPNEDSAYRQRFRHDADVFLDVSGYDTPSLAQRIAHDRIDLLIDLQGYTLHAHTAVFSLRPAPVQVTYLAYLATLGAPWIDYVLLDRMVLSIEERQWWTESVAYLPDTLYLCDDSFVFDARATPGRESLGLPATKFVFCCLNAPWKISPEDFRLWMRILRAVPEAVLWLYADTTSCIDSLRSEAVRLGIDGGRLYFTGKMPHAEHLARFAAADVFLDTRLCNAHTTAIEALACGLPVVSWPGDSVVARVGGSLLRAHGLETLVAESADEYVAIAVRLASDTEYRDQVRHIALRRKGSKLFCSERRVREIECAYETMWARHLAGLPPADFDVPPLEA